MRAISALVALAGLLSGSAYCQEQDDIGLANGITNITLKNFEARFVNESGLLISLKQTGSDFDFLPYDRTMAGERISNSSYYWGDITIQFREQGSKNQSWISGDSAANRTAVTPLHTDALLQSDMNPTMTTGPLKIVREWFDLSGDLGLRFTIKNSGHKTVELGSLGIPAPVNSIFTGLNISQMYQQCSLMDPYIGLDAGHLRVTPISGNGPALAVTPLENTQLEAYRWLVEDYHADTAIGTNAWEGFFEWQIHSASWAETSWKDVEPWNPPTMAILAPGESRQYAVRFVPVPDGIPAIDSAIRTTNTPTAIGIPGYILPRDVPGKLWLQSSSKVASISAFPDGAFEFINHGNKTYTLQASESTWGRVRVTIQWEDGKTQTVSYYITKPGSEAVSDLGSFLLKNQWFDDPSDPFHRSPSVMSYDNSVNAIVDQEPREYIAGISDEGGSGSYVAATVKQAFHPDADEIQRLEKFIDGGLYGGVQHLNFSVKRSAFFYQPSAVPNYTYSPDINWSLSEMDESYANEVNRAYNYVWPSAAYWAFYRVGRAYPHLLKLHDWEWYIDQAYHTVISVMQSFILYNTAGLMGETVWGELLTDLINEGKTEMAENLAAAMKKRVDFWLTEAYPFGSEQSWDCTGQEGVYYWTKHFGEIAMAHKARNTVIGYTPTLPHWGYNGNARRYWDFSVTGKLELIERQIHHYGSGLNGLTLLAAYRSNPSDSYYLRVGYGATSGPTSSIGINGTSSCAMHAWPEHLFWDAYTGDYGPNFLGLTLGSGTYLADDVDVGLVAYGGVLDLDRDVATVQVRDPVKHKIFIGMVRLEVNIDAGIIESFSYNLKTESLSLVLGQLAGAPKAEAAVVWVSQTSASGPSQPSLRKVSAKDVKVTPERNGWRVPLSHGSVQVTIA